MTNKMYLGVIVLFIGLVLVFWNVIFQNLESKSLMISFMTMFGVIVVFSVTLYYELRDVKSQHIVETQLQLYHNKCSSKYELSFKNGTYKEEFDDSIIDASKYESLMDSFILKRFVDYLFEAELDWKKLVDYKQNGIRGISSGTRSKEEIKNDTFYSKQTIYNILKSRGNPLVVGDITKDSTVTLPPDTKLKIHDKSSDINMLNHKHFMLELDNQYVNISILLESDNGSTGYFIGDNKQYTIKSYSMIVTIISKKERLYNKKMPEYISWSNRFANDCLLWSFNADQDYYDSYKKLWAFN